MFHFNTVTRTTYFEHNYSGKMNLFSLHSFFFFSFFSFFFFFHFLTITQNAHTKKRNLRHGFWNRSLLRLFGRIILFRRLYEKHLWFDKSRGNRSRNKGIGGKNYLRMHKNGEDIEGAGF